MTVRIGIIGPGGMGQAHIARITNVLSGGKDPGLGRELLRSQPSNHDRCLLSRG